MNHSDADIRMFALVLRQTYCTTQLGRSKEEWYGGYEPDSLRRIRTHYNLEESSGLFI